jgi:hypothetical protein
MTHTAAPPKPSGGMTLLARARAELAALTMWTALGALCELNSEPRVGVIGARVESTHWP